MKIQFILGKIQLFGIIEVWECKIQNNDNDLGNNFFNSIRLTTKFAVIK